MTRADTPEQLFADALARNPSRPFVTYYDDSTGERSELSLKSLANWVAKTYHLLVDQLGLDVGAAAYLELPAHWISTAPILGAFAAGLRFDTDPGAADVAFVTAETAARATGVPDTFAISTSTAAIGFRDAPPAGTEDFVAAVRPQADAWAGVRLRGGADTPAFAGRTRAELVAHAAERAAALGFAPGSRVLVTSSWHEPADWIDTLLAPLAVGGSVVYVRNGDAAALDRRADSERVTHRL